MAFVRTVKTRSKKGEIYEYLRIVESYYKKGKRKQRVIANLGNIATLRKDIKKIVNGLLIRAGEKPLIFAEDLSNRLTKEYGIGYLTSILWENLGVKKLVSRLLSKRKVELDYGRWIEMMVVNKLSDPRSKLGIFEWLSGVWWIDHGFDSRVLEGDEEIEDNEKEKIRKQEVMKFYRALDYLLEMKEEIENHLYYRFRDLFNIEVDLVFYDLTSSYFEGRGPETLAKLGYSRDHRPGNPQIVIGLILCNGLPIGHEVFEGNRVDKKTLKEVLAKLKNQFKIKRCIFVGDRGLVTKENIRELEETEGFESILALRRRRNMEVKELLQIAKEIPYQQLDFQLEYKEITYENGIRYIICRNPKIKEEQGLERKKDMEEIEKALKELLLRIESSKNPSLKEIVKRVEEILSIHGGHRLYGYSLDEDKRSFEYFKKEENIALEEELDGVYILRTNEKNMDAPSIIDTYRDLQDVERAFRSLKSPLELRPFFHHKEERVRGHVFICVLAYTIKKVMEKMFYQAGLELTGEKAFRLLSQMGIACMNVGEEIYGYVSELTYMQKRIVSALNIPFPKRVIRLAM